MTVTCGVVVISASETNDGSRFSSRTQFRSCCFYCYYCWSFPFPIPLYHLLSPLITSNFFHSFLILLLSYWCHYRNSVAGVGSIGVVGVQIKLEAVLVSLSPSSSLCISISISIIITMCSSPLLYFSPWRFLDGTLALCPSLSIFFTLFHVLEASLSAFFGLWNSSSHNFESRRFWLLFPL